jgi:hypothetical protein
MGVDDTNSEKLLSDRLTRSNSTIEKGEVGDSNHQPDYPAELVEFYELTEEDRAKDHSNAAKDKAIECSGTNTSP